MRCLQVASVVASAPNGGGAAASVALGHESLEPIQALGTALVGTGVALGLTEPRRRIALRPALAS
jgi:hypothetical protein